MSSKLPICAAAFFLLSASAAFAQLTPDEARDRSASFHDDSQIRTDSKQVQSDDAQASRLLHQAGRERGAKREADMAAAQRYKAKAEAERKSMGALNAKNQSTMKDYRSDLAAKPH